MRAKFRVVKFFRDCPKDDGWFGARVIDTKTHESVGIVSDKHMMPRSAAPFGMFPGSTIECDILSESYSDRYGKSYCVSDISVLRSSGSSRQSLIDQLSGPKFKGVGPTTAARVVDAFKCDAEKIAQASVDELVKVAGIKHKQASTIASLLAESSLVLKVAHLFPSLGRAAIETLTEGLIAKDSEPWQELAGLVFEDLVIKKQVKGSMKKGLRQVTAGQILEYLEHNPYEMLVLGVPWSAVDKAAQRDVHVSPTAPERVRYAVLTAIKAILAGDDVFVLRRLSLTRDTDKIRSLGGSTYLDVDDSDVMNALLDKASTYLVGDDLSQQLTRDVLFMVMRDLDKMQRVAFDEDAMEVALSAVARDEKQLALFLRDLSMKDADDATSLNVFRLVGRWMATSGVPLTAEQQRAITICLEAPFSALIGGPGRGKTFCARALADIWQHNMPGNRAVLGLSPTGKAAGRLREMLRDVVAPSGIMTAAKYALYGGEYSFAASRDLEILAIVDEASMLDTETARGVFRRLSECGAHVVLMGDTEQLPSVGPGEFLADVIGDEGISVATLTKNMRAGAGSVVCTHADAIARGQALQALVSEPGFEVAFCNTSDETADRLVAEYKRLWGNGVPASEIGLLCAYSGWNKKTPDPSSAAAMCRRLRDDLNPERQVPSTSWKSDPVRFTNYSDAAGVVIPDTSFGADDLRIGDRILCCKNDTEIQKFEGNLNTFTKNSRFAGTACNGDMGLLARNYFVQKQVGIEFDDGTWALVPYSKLKKHFKLGWAVTVHKSQGCEYEHVLVSVPQNASPTFFTRNLLYTAVTRASQDVVMAGSFDQMKQAVETTRRRRNTKLPVLLAQGVSVSD